MISPQNMLLGQKKQQQNSFLCISFVTIPPYCTLLASRTRTGAGQGKRFFRSQSSCSSCRSYKPTGYYCIQDRRHVSLAASPHAARAGPENTQGYYCIQDRGQRFFNSQSSCSSYRSCKRIRLLL